MSCLYKYKSFITNEHVTLYIFSFYLLFDEVKKRVKSQGTYYYILHCCCYYCYLSTFMSTAHRYVHLDCFEINAKDFQDYFHDKNYDTNVLLLSGFQC